MINLYNIVTDNGTYKPIHAATEDKTIFYAVELWQNGKFIDDVATFRVYMDGMAEGFSGDNIYVVSSEEKIFAELVSAITEEYMDDMSNK